MTASLEWIDDRQPQIKNTKNLLLQLNRRIFSTCSTVGDLYVDGQLCCHVLEDVVRRPGQPRIAGQTAIPAGRYEVVITYSPRCRCPLPLLLGVPGYAGVRIHWGNASTDTEGCLPVGSYDPQRPDWVSSSRATFARLLTRLQTAFRAGQKIYLLIA